MKEIERLPPRKPTTMSVPQMRELLGLGKVESYWLVHKEYFETITVGRKMRVVIASFEKWYAGQFHYKKVNGPEPGAKWTDTTLSVHEVADRLGICTQSVYELMKKKPFDTLRIDNRTRIVTESFEAWFKGQDRYPIIKKAEGGN